MRTCVFRGSVGRLAAKLFMTAAAAAMLAACSNSVDRFSYDNPSDADPVYTASVPKKIARPAYNRATAAGQGEDDTISESPVARAPLPKPGQAQTYDYSQNYKKNYKQPQYAYNKPRLNAPAAPSYDEPSYDAEQYEEPVYGAATKKKPGATVRVGNGMTLYSIARANGLTVKELATANNIRPPYKVVTGQVLRIPGASSAQIPEPALGKKKYQAAQSEDADIPASQSKSAAGFHRVSSGETLYSLGRKYGVSPFVIADANGLSHDDGLKLGQRIKIPGASSSAVASNVKPRKKAPLALTEEENLDTADSTDGESAIGEEPEEIAEAQPAVKVKDVEQVPQEVGQLPAAGNMSLRWPVKGKVISSFGAKPNGLKNEGINIAVPEGTSVRAADGGVVAYAGNELKGYGNLVLIRHAGGYVTAYAHAKELLVKRGDTVKRGDIIAKAGQTGAVSSPQLHFEVRKGATALDPLKYMGSSTALN